MVILIIPFTFGISIQINMTRDFASINYLLLPGNGGILLASDNILSKNHDLINFSKTRETIAASIAKLRTVLKTLNR